jgi:hypothetical protein
MSPDTWERYVNPDSRYEYDENTDRFHDHGNGFWHSEGGTIRQEYTSIRNSEIQTREKEIFHHVLHFYFSGKGVIVLVISMVLSLITSTFSVEGLFFWNFLLLMMVWIFYEMTIRKKVRADWEEIEEEIVTF